MRFINKQYKKFLTWTALVILFVNLMACASLSSNNEEKIDVKKYATIKSSDAVKQLENIYKQSDEENIDEFAPQHFLTAKKALTEAQILVSNNAPRDKIISKVAVGEAMLKNGDRVASKVKDMLENELALKEKLNALNSPTIYQNEYGSLLGRLDAVIRDIEKGNVNETKASREKLVADMQKLELRAVRYNALHEPQEILKRVKYRGGERLAPITFGEAVDVYTQAEKFIRENPDYEAGVERMGEEALFAAKRALHITEQVAALSQKVAYAPEQVILDEEYRMHRVAREFNNTDLRNNPLELQSELLAKQAREKTKEYKNKEELILALRDTLINVRDSSSQLTALTQKSNKLANEKTQWLSKEANLADKITQLEIELKVSQEQLNSVQQKVLTMSEQNSQLTSALSAEKNKAMALSNKLEKSESLINEIKSTTPVKTIKNDQSEEIKPVKNETNASAEPNNENVEPPANTKIETSAAAPSSLEKEITEPSTASEQANVSIEEEQIVENSTVEVSNINSEVNAFSDQAQPTTLNNDGRQVEITETAQLNTEIKTVSEIDNETATNLSETKLPEEQTIAAMSVTEQNRPKVTKEETLKALESVKELISLFQNKDDIEDNAVNKQKPSNENLETPSQSSLKENDLPLISTASD